jgi:hypothetical protein
MLFDLSFTKEYKNIKKRKQDGSDAHTNRENSKRAKFEYKVNNQILLDKEIPPNKVKSKKR